MPSINVNAQWEISPKTTIDPTATEQTKRNDQTEMKHSDNKGLFYRERDIYIRIFDIP